MSDIEKILSAMVDAGRKASLAIMDIYRKGFDVTLKEDFSPVTDADLASDGIIRRTLPLGEDIAYLSEEEADDKSRLGKKALFIVDPLDGTQDFVEKDADGHVITWLVPNSQRNEMEPILITLRAGAASVKDMPHEGEEFGFVKKGEVVLHLGKKEFAAKEGDSFYYESNKVHYLENRSAKDAEVIWVASPPTF